MRYQKNFRFGLIITAALICVACSAKILTTEGKFVAEDRRIELSEGGTYQGSWETRDLTVDYEYLRSQDKLHILGQVSFQRERSMDYFHCKVVFVSSDGTILQIKRVVSAPAYQEIRQLSFNRELELLEGSRWMAFSYSGATSGGGGSGSPNLFWSVPW
jgi:hypothetical protein